MGRYNKITNKVIKDIFNTIKSNENLLVEPLTFEVGEYSDEKSGLNFYVELNVANSKNSIFINGMVSEIKYQPPDIVIDLHWDWSTKNQFQQIYVELRNIVRHEIEHLTQWGFNANPFKKVNSNQQIREKIKRGKVREYKYFLLKDEVDANIQGLYSMSKSLKKDFQIVIDRYLYNFVKEGLITQKEKKIIYNKWKKRIPKIGGIPTLK